MGAGGGHRPGAVAAPGSTDPLATIQQGEGLLVQARQAISAYRTDQARDLLRRAVELVDGVVLPGGGDLYRRLETLRLRLRLTAVWVTFEAHGLSRAVAELAVLRGQCLDAGRPDVAAACDVQLSLVRGRSGDLPGALQAMRDVEELRPLLPVGDQARLLVNRGTLSAQAMELEQASGDLAQAGQLAGRAGLPELVFMALHNQGYVEFLRGDLPRALHLMERAEGTEAQVERGVAHLDRARVLLEAGLVDEAHDALQLAARITAEAGGHHDLGEIELALARADLLTGDAASAARRAAEARRRFRKRQAAGWRRVAQVVELEAQALAVSAPTARVRLATALQATARAAGDEQVALRSGLLRAEALADQGRHEEAAEALAGARALLRSPHLATRMTVHYVTAHVDSTGGHPQAAARALRRAARDLGAARHRAARLDLRTALAVHGHRLVALDLDLAVRSGSVPRILTRTEVWRDVVRTLPPVHDEPDPRTAGLVSRLRRLREDLRCAPPGTDTTALGADVLAAERAVREADWATVAAGDGASQTAPLTARQISLAVAAAGVSLISYFLSAGVVHAVLVRPDGRRALQVIGPVREIAGMVQATQSDLAAAARVPAGSPLRAAVRASLQQGLQRLDEVLLAPPGTSGSPRPTPWSDGPLVVVPTPMLTAVPWGMLPSRRGRPTTVARSATTWAARHTDRAGSLSVSALAGPDVPLADDEVAQVVRVWGHGRVISSATSRSRDVVAALGGSDLVHVAAHGEHHAQSPLFSSLRLGDGVVFAHEMEGRRLRASHVVLSACDGGRVSVRRGDESLGMTASLLALGVGTVVAPVSAIPDELAHQTMAAYHAELARGMDAATALARTTGGTDLLAASFTCFGSGWRWSPSGGKGPA